MKDEYRQYIPSDGRKKVIGRTYFPSTIRYDPIPKTIPFGIVFFLRSLRFLRTGRDSNSRPPP